MDIKGNTSPFASQQEKLIEDSLKSLNIALKQASMYSYEHPVFKRAIRELKAKLNGLAAVRRNIKISASAEAVFIEGHPFKPESIVSKELAGYFHKRKIETVILDTGVVLGDLEKFIYNFSRALEEVKKTSSPGEDIKNIQGVEIKELDYSALLSTEGGKQKDVFKILLGLSETDQEDTESINYLISHVSDITNRLKQGLVDLEALKKVFNKFDYIAKSKDKILEENSRDFAGKISASLFGLPDSFIKEFSQEGKFPNLKAVISRQIDKQSLFKSLLDKILSAKKFNPLFANLCSSIAGEDFTHENIAENLEKAVETLASDEEKKQVQETFQEILFSETADEFIPQAYKNMLLYLGQRDGQAIVPLSIQKRVKQELRPEYTKETYFSVLLELFLNEENLADFKMIVSHLDKAFRDLLNARCFLQIKTMLSAMEEKMNNCTQEQVAIIGDFRNRCIDERLEKTVLDSLAKGRDSGELFYILAKLEKPLEDIVRGFLAGHDVGSHKKTRDILARVMNEDVLVLLRKNLRPGLSPFIYKEIIEMASKVKSGQIQPLLSEAYKRNKNNYFIIQEIVSVAENSPYFGKSFFKDFLNAKEAMLRERVVNAYLKRANAKDREDLANVLLGQNNFLGYRDNLISENIDILANAGCKEAVPVLIDIALKKPILFRKKRQALRQKSVKALLALRPEETEKIKQLLAENK